MPGEPTPSYRLPTLDGATDPVADVDDVVNAALAAIDSTLAALNALVPIGAWLPFPGDSLPQGFLWARGQTVSRTTYAALFAVYGERFGAGDGVTTFHLPNLTRAVPFGAGGDLAPGATGGAETHGHSVALPPHRHGGNIPWHSHNGTMPWHVHGIAMDGAHSHSIQGSNLGTRSNYVWSNSGNLQQGAYLQNTSPPTAPIDAAGAHSHGGQTAGPSATGFTTGGPSATAFTTTDPTTTPSTFVVGPNLPPFVATHWIIRAL